MITISKKNDITKISFAGEFARPPAKSNDRAIVRRGGSLRVGHTKDYKQRDLNLRKAMIAARAGMDLPAFGMQETFVLILLADDGYIKDSHNTPKYFCDLLEAFSVVDNDSVITCFAIKKKLLPAKMLVNLDMKITDLYIMLYNELNMQRALTHLVNG